MFGYIRKTKVLEIIENGQKQLSDREIDIVLNRDICKNEKERLEFTEAINKLRGGNYYLECLKKHFK